MVPDEKVLLDNLGMISYTLDKTYLTQLKENYRVVEFDDNKVNITSNIRAIKVNRWVFSKEEKIGECFKNILSLFSGGENSIALVIVRKPESCDMYFIVKNEGVAQNEYSKNNIELLNSSIKGNFPGTHTTIEDIENIKNLFSFPYAKSIAILENTPSEFSEDHITQGIDKLLNGIIPTKDEDSYMVVLLAESLTQNSIRDIISGFEDIATAIHPFMSYQFQIGKNEINTTGEIKSISKTKSIAESISKTHSVNIGINASFKGIIGGSIGYGYSFSESKSVSNGNTETDGTSSSISIGTSESTSYTYKSYLVANMLEKLESTMKRINESQATGLWKYGTYVIANNSMMSKNVANYMRAITQGNDSYIEPSAIQEWSYISGDDSSPFSEIKKYITHFTHPVFVSSTIEKENKIFVNATAYVSTPELSHVFAFPRKSIQGLPVLECVQFGREPHTLIPTKQDVQIGNAYHMHEIITSQRISISKEELTKHTFITGSTGSGKSNTIYKILDSLDNNDVKFLVVEPAKGEYKYAFASKGVLVFGTNPNMKDTEMLRINPFRFPKKTHILEHLDRLVEIFNVCWPMYAAMPAILKDSIERAYVVAGWDLLTSKNKYKDNLFPTFSDVVIQIKQVLNESDYSNDNKGDYIGSLVTRLKSLTNGINGIIFSNNDICDDELFDRNAIVDLSRIGSTETKALIMGLLVLKLQEYRMESNEPNSNLKHITVLEEAHNLLKRTSTQQRSEGSNLLGKSVEMLANSIAEMRTYGEGFIIADQSPGLLDMSVIRNTNTKIILRLPDFSDRELVGRAAGLNEDQIIELGRLEKGVAAISQSDWLEPVLCKIDKYDETSKKNIEKEGHKLNIINNENEEVEKDILNIIMRRDMYRTIDRVDTERFISKALKSNLKSTVKLALLDYVKAEKDKKLDFFRILAYEFFDAENIFEKLNRDENIRNWTHNIVKNLQPSIEEYSSQEIDEFLALLLYEMNIRNNKYNKEFKNFTELFQKEGRVY